MTKFDSEYPGELIAAGRDRSRESAAARPRGRRPSIGMAYLIVGHRYQLNYNKLLHHAPENANQTQDRNMAPSFCQFPQSSPLLVLGANEGP